MIVIQPTCPIGDWPVERAQRGLVVQRWEVQSDPQTARLIVTAVIDPQSESGETVRIQRNGEPPPALPKPPQAPPGRQAQEAPPGPQPQPWRPPVTLRDTIADLIQRAAAQPGRPQRAFLRGGLRIDLLFQDGQTHLQISRARVDPSATEWDVTLANFPYTVPLVQDKALSHQGRFYRAASWPTPGLAEARPSNP